jgi:hypothetical protein
MRKKVILLLIFWAVLLLPDVSIGQAIAPDLGGARDFALFTAAGAIGNNGLTIVTGNLGTNAGVISGFPPGVVIGTIFIADSTTTSAANDVQAAYMSLGLNACDSTLDPSTGLGHNQVLKPYVYCIISSTSLNDTLILDGQNDPNSLFIFKIDGVFSTSTLSRIILINSASLRNVYFQINGAFNLGADAIFRGTVIADGAINLGYGSTLLGRGLSTSDAINLDSNIVTLASLTPLPINLLDFSATMEGDGTRLKWSTATEQSSQSFMAERSGSAQEGSWKAIGTMPAAGSSTSVRRYSITDNHATAGANYYRLRSTDLDGSYQISKVVVTNFDAKRTPVNIFPNPVANSLTVTGAMQGSAIILMDMAGRTLMNQIAVDDDNQMIISQLDPGAYVLKVMLPDGRATTIKLNKQ